MNLDDTVNTPAGPVSKKRLVFAATTTPLALVLTIYFILRGGSPGNTLVGLFPPKALITSWIALTTFPLLFALSTKLRWGLATLSLFLFGGIVLFITPAEFGVSQNILGAGVIATGAAQGGIALYAGVYMGVKIATAAPDQPHSPLESPSPDADLNTGPASESAPATENTIDPTAPEQQETDGPALPPEDVVSPLQIANNIPDTPPETQASESEDLDDLIPDLNSDRPSPAQTDEPDPSPDTAVTDETSDEATPSTESTESDVQFDGIDLPDPSEEDDAPPETDDPEDTALDIDIDIKSTPDSDATASTQSESPAPDSSAAKTESATEPTEAASSAPDQLAAEPAPHAEQPEPDADGNEDDAVEADDETETASGEEEDEEIATSPEPASVDVDTDTEVEADTEASLPRALAGVILEDDAIPNEYEPFLETRFSITPLTDDEDAAGEDTVEDDAETSPDDEDLSDVPSSDETADMPTSTEADSVDATESGDRDASEASSTTPGRASTSSAGAEAAIDESAISTDTAGAMEEPSASEETDTPRPEQYREALASAHDDESVSHEEGTVNWSGTVERLKQAIRGYPGGDAVLGASDEDTDQTRAIEEAGRSVIQQLAGPESIKIDGSQIESAGRYSRTYLVTEWPREVQGHFLYELYRDTRLEFNMSIHADPQSRKDSVGKLGDLESKLNDKVKGELAEYLPNIEATEQTLSEIRELKRSVENEGVRMFDASVYITIYGDSKDSLENAERIVREHLEISAGLDTERASEYLDEAWMSSAPLGMNIMGERREKATQYLKSTQVAHLFPFIEDTVMEDNGTIYGYNLANGTPVILDLFNRNNGYNVLVIGSIGSGKSHSEGQYLIRHRQANPEDNITIIDPMAGFIGVNEAIGGERIVVNGQRTLNPLELRKTPMRIVKEKDVDPWSMKINEVKWFFHMYFETFGDSDSGISITPQQWAPLMRAVKKAYKENGITPDPRTHGNPSPTLDDVMEILSDIAEHPEEYANSNAAKEIDLWSSHASEVLMALEAFQPGGELENLVGETDLEISPDKPTYIDMQQLEGRGETLDIMLRIMFNIVYEQAKETTARSIVAIDEAHKIIGDGSSQNASHWEEVFRHSRHHDLSIHLLSQEFEDFFQNEDGDGANEAAKTMAALCTVRRIHRVNNLNRRLAKEGLGLTDDHCGFIENAVTGEDSSKDFTTALLDIEDIGKVGLKVESTDEEIAAIDYDGEPPSEIDRSLPQRAQQLQRTLAVRHHMTNSLPDLDNDETIADLIRKIPLPQMNDKAKANFINRVITDPHTPFTPDDRPTIEKRFGLREEPEDDSDAEAASSSRLQPSSQEASLPPVDATTADTLSPIDDPADDSSVPSASSGPTPDTTADGASADSATEQETDPDADLDTAAADADEEAKTDVDDTDDAAADSDETAPSPATRNDASEADATDASPTRNLEDFPHGTQLQQLSEAEVLTYAGEIDGLDPTDPTPTLRLKIAERCEDADVLPETPESLPGPNTLGQQLAHPSD